MSINIETGKTYVVHIKDGSTAEVLHKYSKRESIIYNIGSISKSILKVLVVIVSIAIPPLLFITIPLMRGSKRVK